MKIAFFWTWDFSKNILFWISKYEDIEICLLVSQPDKQVWRKKEIVFTPIKKYWLENSIKVLQPNKLIKNEEFKDHLKSLNLDFIVVVAYWKIIPESILNIPKYGSINIHGSILPLYRWASPIQESLKNGDEKTWLTIMYMSKWMDEWDILKIEEIKVDILDKTSNLFKKFESIWPELLYNTLVWIISWDIKWLKQDHNKASYCSKISKKDWKIDFLETKVYQIYNKFRAYYIWPWIYTYFKDKKLDIIDCLPLDLLDPKLENTLDKSLFTPWKVIKINKKLVWVVCCDNKVIILKQLKLEWKKTMDILSFVNWNKEFLDYKFN